MTGPEPGHAPIIPPIGADCPAARVCCFPPDGLAASCSAVAADPRPDRCRLSRAAGVLLPTSASPARRSALPADSLAPDAVPRYPSEHRSPGRSPRWRHSSRAPFVLGCCWGRSPDRCSSQACGRTRPSPDAASPIDTRPPAWFRRHDRGTHRLRARDLG
ncbi:predicted protein [Streptomyces sp. AA4]|nr:predicted protein [Streptomyces sp. AA4]